MKITRYYGGPGTDGGGDPRWGCKVRLILLSFMHVDTHVVAQAALTLLKDTPARRAYSTHFGRQLVGQGARAQKYGLPGKPLKVGRAVPQSAIIPIVTRHYGSGLLTSPRIRQKTVNATEDPILCASNGPD
jgi:hypothetical protein